MIENKIINNIKEIAESLEWHLGKLPITKGTYIKKVGKSLMYWEDTDIILFAAYVRSEMAKRYQWWFSSEDGLLRFECDAFVTEYYDFDYTDPIRESCAVLQAAIEVLKVENNRKACENPDQ